jgi:predicted nucleic acid-binding protein
MNVVDSSGWIEFFTDGTNANIFAPLILKLDELIVPTIIIYEVYKKIAFSRDHEQAIEVIAHIQQAKHIVNIDTTLALEAAQYSLEYKLPMADSLIYATTKKFKATLWTQDIDFEKIPHVRYIEKKSNNPLH